jgi:hypothetical protein
MSGRSSGWRLLLLGLAGCPQFQNDDWVLSGDASSSSEAGDASASDSTVRQEAGGSRVDDGAAAESDERAADQATATEDTGIESGVRDASASDGSVTAQDLYCNRPRPRGITLSFNADICWIEGATLRDMVCAPAAGGGPIMPISGPNDAPFLATAFDLVLDANYVYWTNGRKNQVLRRQQACGGQPQQYFTGGDGVSFLARGDGLTLWATDFADPSDFGSPSTSSEVIVGPISPGSPSSNGIYAGERGVSGVALHNPYVYWGTANGLAFGSPTGGPITRIQSPEKPVYGVAVDALGIAYFLAGKSIYRFESTMPFPTALYTAPQALGTGDVEVDDNYVYFSEPDIGCIVRIAK